MSDVERRVQEIAGCTGCEWEGDYFADGEAGPFDDHLAAAVLAWLADALIDEGTVTAVKAALWGVRADVSSATDAALATLRERLGVDGGEEVGG